MVALSIEGKDARVYVIDTATARPLLRGRVAGRTVSLSGEGIKAQGSISGAAAVLTLVGGGRTQTVRLAATGPGSALLRARSRTGAAEAIAIVSDFELRVSVAASTSTGPSPAPTLRSVVLASRGVAFPDSILRKLEDERESRELLCDLLRAELAAIESKRLTDKLAEVTVGLQRVRRALETATGTELKAAGATAALVSARHAEIREIVAAIDRAAKARIQADVSVRISQIEERAERLGCTL